jgi:nicotinate-nucleotide adenylyltransferase
MTHLILFGGAFDPPHNGHVHMAQAATQALQPDRLLWIPTANPPHREQAQASFRQRCDMVNLIIASEPTWELCPIENERPEKSYFIDTLNTLHEQNPDAKLSVLIGQDQLQHFTRWHQWKAIAEQARIVVMPRAGCDCTALPGYDIQLLRAPELDACSTEIRQLRDRTSLPESVYRYITSQELY